MFKQVQGGLKRFKELIESPRPEPDGSYVATLSAADGTLPAAETCRLGTAALTLQGDRQRAIDLVAVGDVCGKHAQPPFIVTQVFTGQYEIASPAQKRFLGDEAFFSARLGDDGHVSVAGIDR